MDKKKKILGIIYSLIIILLLGGVSFAIYTYSFEGKLNKLESHSIELEFLESTNEVISMNNVVPISDETGKTQNDYFAFQIRTKTINPSSIGYSINLEKLEPLQGYTSLNDNEVKIYLTDYENKPLINPTLVSDLDNYQIYKRYHTHDQNTEEVISKYKLRMWVDENVTGKTWNQNTKIEYSFKIGVNALKNDTYTVIFDSNN